MLLAIDIGNTNVTFGVFRDKTLVTTWRIETDVNRMPDEYALILLNLLQLQGTAPGDISGVALCSTVPPLVAVFEELCQRYFKTKPFMLVPGVRTGVRVRTDNPREVGADRIANAVAAHHLYQCPAIIVDVGTATTFDVVSKEGDFLGGAIATGITTAAEALYRRAAALPRVELVHPKQVIGTNTIAAMQSGIVYGYVGLVEGIVTRMQRELGSRATVIATGGYASIITGETAIFDAVNPDITLIGLRLVYEMNQPQPEGGATTRGTG